MIILLYHASTGRMFRRKISVAMIRFLQHLERTSCKLVEKLTGPNKARLSSLILQNDNFVPSGVLSDV